MIRQAVALAPAATALAVAACLWALADERARRRVRHRLPLGADDPDRTSGGRPGGPALPAAVARALEAAAVTDPSAAVSRWLLATGGLALGSLLLPALRLPAVAVAVAGPAVVVARRGRAAARRRAGVPAALDVVAAGLRGGHPLPRALGDAARSVPVLCDELLAVVHAHEAGQPLVVALRDWGGRHPDTATAVASGALAVAAEVGGPGARAVDGAASSIRDRLAAEAEASAAATQGTASAAVLTVAPVAFATMLAGLDPAAGGFLLGTPAGWACLALGVGLDLLGACWMAMLVRRAR